MRRSFIGDRSGFLAEGFGYRYYNYYYYYYYYHYYSR